MTDMDIIAVFKQHRPKTVKEMETLGLEPAYKDSGSVRTYYMLSPTLGVKVDMGSKKYQTENEIASMEKIHTDPKLKHLRPHAPPMLYGDSEYGILVTTHYPKSVPYAIFKLDPSDQMLEELRRLQREFNRIGISDVGIHNLRLSQSGVMMLVDLGCNCEPMYVRRTIDFEPFALL